MGCNCRDRYKKLENVYIIAKKTADIEKTDYFIFKKVDGLFDYLPFTEENKKGKRVIQIVSFNRYIAD